jgi:leucyl aminopeptidase
MDISIVDPGGVAFDKKSCVAVAGFEDDARLSAGVVAEADRAALQGLRDAKVIRGKAEELYYLPTPNSPYAGVLVFGMGKPADATAETARRAGGAAADTLRKNRIARMVVDITQLEVCFAADAFLEGIVFGQYDFHEYKKQEEDRPVLVEAFTVVASGGSDGSDVLRRAALVAANTNLIRDLANRASNDVTPTTLAEFANDIARETGCECEVLTEDDMHKLGMNALLGVAKGSAEPATLIILHYKSSDTAPILAIVGKGITFDSGGISIKPAEAMHEMKYDMCGAAAVLGAFKSIAELKPAVNLIAVVPAAENMTGSAAQKPGDIVRAFNGKTIEVHNTDAEGRLALADAMAYVADKYKPAAMVDLATLTGACVVALGHYAAAVMTPDDALFAELQTASDASGERIWRLPLWDDYGALIKGTHADLCNIGPRGEAGAITSACFLKEFAGDVPWAHLDIAGTAWGGKKISYQNPSHASGYGVRLLTQWILNRAQQT